MCGNMRDTIENFNKSVMSAYNVPGVEQSVKPLEQAAPQVQNTDIALAKMAIEPNATLNTFSAQNPFQPFKSAFVQGNEITDRFNTSVDNYNMNKPLTKANSNGLLGAG